MFPKLQMPMVQVVLDDYHGRFISERSGTTLAIFHMDDSEWYYWDLFRPGIADTIRDFFEAPTRLERWRLAHGFTFRDLELITGMARATLYIYCMGTKKPSLQKRIKLFRRLGWLMPGMEGWPQLEAEKTRNDEWLERKESIGGSE